MERAIAFKVLLDAIVQAIFFLYSGKIYSNVFEEETNLSDTCKARKQKAIKSTKYGLNRVFVGLSDMKRVISQQKTLFLNKIIHDQIQIILQFCFVAKLRDKINDRLCQVKVSSHASLAVDLAWCIVNNYFLIKYDIHTNFTLLKVTILNSMNSSRRP